MPPETVAAAVKRGTQSNEQPLDASLRGYLETNADIVTRITKPVRLDDVGALSAQSDQPIVFENIVEKPGFRLCDMFVKNRRSQARALGVTPENYLKTLAFRLRQPPRGLINVKTGPVKEVIRTGSDADWTILPIPRHKDVDAAPYVTAMNIIRDPETGFYNSCHAGTYADRAAARLDQLHHAALAHHHEQVPGDGQRQDADRLRVRHSAGLRNHGQFFRIAHGHVGRDGNGRHHHGPGC